MQIVQALDDAETKVRRNAYEALIRLSISTMPAVHALIEAKYPSTLVAKAANENVQLQPLALRLLVQCLRDEVGLEEVRAPRAAPRAPPPRCAFRRARCARRAMRSHDASPRRPRVRPRA